MSVTGLGKRYARRIRDGTITLAEVPARYQTDAADSFIELFGCTIGEAA